MAGQKQVNIHEAKTHLSALIQEVERGKEVVMARDGKPVARLVRVREARRARKPGSAKGMVLYMSPDFDKPLPDDIVEEFYK